MVANALICLIHQANYLLDRQISTLEGRFVAAGGYREQLAAARLARRGTEPASPRCPLCGKPMRRRTARRGRRAGASFLGCSAFPNCRATLPLP